VAWGEKWLFKEYVSLALLQKSPEEFYQGEIFYIYNKFLLGYLHYIRGDS
jgi:hypothetical protein